MGFYRDIGSAYGNQVVHSMKRWASFTTKLARQSNRRIFLLRCRKAGILPGHILNSQKNIQVLLLSNGQSAASEINKFNSRLGRSVISLEIKLACSNISKINSSIKFLKSQVKEIIPLFVFNEFAHRLNSAYNKVFNEVKRGNLKKFDNLRQGLPEGFTLFLNNNKWFRNVSSVDIPTRVSDFLSLGPKFGISSGGGGAEIKRFIADVEGVVDQLPESVKNVTRARIANNVTNYSHQINSSINSPFIKQYNDARRFLKSNPDLYIVQADKGGCTVAMDKKDYISKTVAILQDTATYKQLKKDPTLTIQRNHNDLIKNLNFLKEITSEEAKHLTIYNSIFPKLYCLPKIHKPDIPLRPIISSMNSTTYNLSKHLGQVLTSAFAEATDYNVKDTFSFVNAIDGTILPRDYVLISLDVVSLFTNIPLELVTDILKLHWHKVESFTRISQKNFLKLVTFVFSNSYFAFDGRFYLQIFGTPMGSPLSPILALIVLDHLLNEIIPKLPFQLPFIYKFVDDIVCAVPSGHIQTTLDLMNSYNKHIQFTVETETDNSVPFLDTKLIRDQNNSILLDWYQKPTASGRFINYYSDHPLNQKYNTVIAMKNRITRICNEKFLRQNLSALFSIFSNNGYPKHILNCLIYNSNMFDGQADDNVNINYIYKKLPYIKNLTELVIGHFKAFPTIKIAKYNITTNKNLFTKLKEKTPDSMMSNVIYNIPCRDCRGCYVGQTSQWLRQRLTQHKSDCRIGKKSCALSVHFQETNHEIDYGNVKIVEIENNYRTRLFLEMFHIAKNSNTINFKSDTSQLSLIYCNILENIV